MHTHSFNSKVFTLVIHEPITIVKKIFNHNGHLFPKYDETWELILSLQIIMHTDFIVNNLYSIQYKRIKILNHTESQTSTFINMALFNIYIHIYIYTMAITVDVSDTTNKHDTKIH